jgi:NADH-quinone oxidoreductase subunit A
MPASSPLWPLALYALLVAALVTAMLVLSWLLGSRHCERATGQPYESGMLPTDAPHLRLPANYYLLAMFFVIFDLEAVFLYAWAVSARQAGWAALGEVALFIGVLLAALGYLWGVGALDWGTSALKSTAEEVNPDDGAS